MEHTPTPSCAHPRTVTHCFRVEHDGRLNGHGHGHGYGQKDAGTEAGPRPGHRRWRHLGAMPEQKARTRPQPGTPTETPPRTPTGTPHTATKTPPGNGRDAGDRRNDQASSQDTRGPIQGTSGATTRTPGPRPGHHRGQGGGRRSCKTQVRRPPPDNLCTTSHEPSVTHDTNARLTEDRHSPSDQFPSTTRQPDHPPDQRTDRPTSRPLARPILPTLRPPDRPFDRSTARPARPTVRPPAQIIPHALRCSHPRRGAEKTKLPERC